MAATNYSNHVGGRQRRNMPRDQYLLEIHQHCARGQDVGRSVLLDLDVISIRSAVRQRDALRKHITDNLTNAALAKQYGTHIRTIDKIVNRETWSHIA